MFNIKRPSRHDTENDILYEQQQFIESKAKASSTSLKG